MEPIRSPRGSARLFLLVLISLFLPGLSSTLLHAQGGMIEVTTFADELDGNSADGSGVSLREAIRDANASAGDEVIHLPAGTYTLSLIGENEDLNATGDLDIADAGTGGNLTIIGENATIDGDGLDRIFHTVSGAHLTLRGLTLTGGLAAYGGAVLSGGTLVAVDCTFHGNLATPGSNGGAIEIGGPATIDRCTFYNNSADDGGAVSIGATGDAEIANATFNGNTATLNGGAIYNPNGNLTLAHVTISGNRALTQSGGGISNAGGTLDLINSIVTGNTASSDANLENSGTIATDTGNVVDTPPLLAPLGFYGGPTRTMPPLPASPAIDAGDDTLRSSIDQLGETRGLRVEAGAVEVHSLLCARLIIEDGGVIFNVTNAKDSGGGSLRDAIAQVNASGNPDGAVILFSRKLRGRTIKLTTGELEITNTTAPIVIAAASLPTGSTIPVEMVGGVILSGNDQSRVLDTAPSTAVKLFNLTIRDGNATGGGGISNAGHLGLERCRVLENRTGEETDGGGILNAGGAILDLNGCVISGNRTGGGGASGDGGSGGGIASTNATLAIFGSTLSGNRTGESTGAGTTGGPGGGIHGLDSTISILNSTISGNRTGHGADSAGDGGGIHNPAGTLTIVHSTIAANETGTGGMGGGVLDGDAAFTLINSIVAGNTAPGGDDEISGTVDTENGINLTSGVPRLAPLGNYGGETETMAPLPGSPALDTADSAFSVDFDQRGVDRPQGSGPDIGAVEYDAEFLDGFFTRSGVPAPAVSPAETDENFNAELSPARYSGLVRDPSGNAVGNSTVNVTGSGAFSLNLFVQSLNLRVRLRDTLAPDGSFMGSVEIDGKMYDIDLQLVKTTGGEEALRIAGVLHDLDSGIDYDLGLDRPFYHPRNNPAPFAGRFTALLPTDPEAPVDTPKGDGYGLVTVNTGGTVKLAGVLPDNSKFSLSGFISEDDEWRVFQKLYGKRGGRIGGTVTFRDIPTVSDFDGTLDWVKNPAAKGDFLSGIDMPLAVVGSAFRMPFRNEAVLFEIVTANDSNATWQIGHGNVPNPGVKPIFWQANNKIAARGLGEDEILRIGANTGNGLVTGFFTDAAQGTMVKFRGVAFQKQGIASGVFPGNDGQTGFFLIEPDGEPALLVDGQGTGASFDFGDVGVDGGIGEMVLPFENAGTANLFLPEGPVLPHGSPFVAVNTGAVLIGPGESTLVKFRFDPDAPGAAGETVTVRSNEPQNNPFGFDLTGNGIAGSDDGSLISRDQWAGTSPGDRVAPFETTPIGNGNFDAASHGGKYEGYIREDIPTRPLIGRMTLNMSARTGAFSAVATVFGVKHTLRGTFQNLNDDGSAAGFTNRGLSYFLRVHDTAGGKIKVLGFIGGHLVELVRGWNPSLDGNSPFAGRYTTVLPSSEERGAGQPTGDGYGSITVGTNGAVRGTMILADGTKAAAAGYLSQDTEWLLYRDLYRTRPRGFIGGRVVFRDIAESDFDGELQWVKHEDKNEKLFPHGFELLQPILGSSYEPKPAGEFALDFLEDDLDNIVVTFSESALGPIPPLPATWLPSNRITYVSLNREKISMKFNAKTGLVSGTGVEPDEKIRLKFGGAVFQKQDLCTGTFTGNGTAGLFSVTPQEVIVVSQAATAAPPTSGIGYSDDQVQTGKNTEHRLKFHGHHFASIYVDHNIGRGTSVFRPHPGVDPNGWGSTLHLQPFFPGAQLRHTREPLVSFEAGGIRVDSGGKVSLGKKGSTGEWTSSIVFSYDPGTRTVDGAGTYTIILPGGPAGRGEDLNLYKLASNRLEMVPLLEDAGDGDTGDTSLVEWDFGGGAETWDFMTTFPTDEGNNLFVHAFSSFYNVDTIAQGFDPVGIKPAYKPSLEVLLEHTGTGDLAMSFGATFNEAEARDFSRDNIGITPLIKASSSREIFSFDVTIASQPHVNDGAGDDFTLMKLSHRKEVRVYHATAGDKSFNTLIGELRATGDGTVEATLPVPLDLMGIGNLFRTVRR